MSERPIIHADVGPHTAEIARMDGVPFEPVRLCGAKDGRYENTDMIVALHYHALPVDVTCPACIEAFQQRLRFRR